MTALRSLLFNVAFVMLTTTMAIAGLPVLLGSRRAVGRYGRCWCRASLWLARVCCGLSWEVRGAVPQGPVIVASKHQSAWDTLVLPILLDRPAFVLKRELVLVPLVGLYFLRSGQIGVDRSAGASALRGMVRQANRVVREGRPIVIYPEGTRMAPGRRGRYLPGVAALYGRLGLPVVPVALNSGRFWGRRAFRKRPGCIVIEFLPAIAPGRERGAFLADLEEAIETACERLDREADPRP